MAQGFLIYKLELVASGSKAVCRMGCGNGKNGHLLFYKEKKDKYLEFLKYVIFIEIYFWRNVEEKVK